MSDRLQKISVVIPTYNSRATIERALHSVLAQTLTALEVIVVDDASIDDTVSIVESLRESFNTHNIHLSLIELENNKGPGAARNIGIQKAKGEFLAFLDSDDFWLPNHLQIALEVIAQIKFQKAVVSHSPQYAESFNPLLTKNRTDKPLVFRSLSLFKYLLIRKPVSTISVVTPRDLAIKAGKFPEERNYAEDFEYFIRLHRVAGSWIEIRQPITACVGKPLFGSRTGLSSATWKMQKGTFRALNQGLKGHNVRLALPFLYGWHLLKFVRRVITIAARDHFTNRGSKELLSDEK